MSLEPSLSSSPSGQGPVPWERQEWDRILGRGYIRGERGGLGWATTPQSAISLSSRNIHEAPAITCQALGSKVNVCILCPQGLTV